ncbi:MAG: Lrp/AsnC ligand binding domain-containing protein [Candidatus Bathyarchaeota archaeon]|nr:MAG: Lrp/AsnC ligand binding domain-containing protein [Candidatus Bathyarchaeota archaeon]
MIEACILLRVRPGMDRSVFQTVKKLKQVKDIETVYGAFDLLMKIQVETMENLDAFIFDTIRTIKGVERTTTLITIEPPSENH